MKIETAKNPAKMRQTKLKAFSYISIPVNSLYFTKFLSTPSIQTWQKMTKIVPNSISHKKR
jgi:hypothetical protein